MPPLSDVLEPLLITGMAAGAAMVVAGAVKAFRAWRRSRRL